MAEVGSESKSMKVDVPGLADTDDWMTERQRAAAVKLLQLDQGHLFGEWAPGKRTSDRQAALDSVTAQADGYPGGLSAYVAQAKKYLATQNEENPLDRFTPAVPSCVATESLNAASTDSGDSGRLNGLWFKQATYGCTGHESPRTHVHAVSAKPKSHLWWLLVAEDVPTHEHEALFAAARSTLPAGTEEPIIGVVSGVDNAILTDMVLRIAGCDPSPFHSTRFTGMLVPDAPSHLPHHLTAHADHVGGNVSAHVAQRVASTLTSDLYLAPNDLAVMIAGFVMVKVTLEPLLEAVSNAESAEARESAKAAAVVKVTDWVTSIRLMLDTFPDAPLVAAAHHRPQEVQDPWLLARLLEREYGMPIEEREQQWQTAMAAKEAKARMYERYFWAAASQLVDARSQLLDARSKAASIEATAADLRNQLLAEKAKLRRALGEAGNWQAAAQQAAANLRHSQDVQRMLRVVCDNLGAENHSLLQAALSRTTAPPR